MYCITLLAFLCSLHIVFPLSKFLSTILLSLLNTKKEINFIRFGGRTPHHGESSLPTSSPSSPYTRIANLETWFVGNQESMTMFL